VALRHGIAARSTDPPFVLYSSEPPGLSIPPLAPASTYRLRLARSWSAWNPKWLCFVNFLIGLSPIVVLVLLISVGFPVQSGLSDIGPSHAAASAPSDVSNKAIHQ
jgi:hypothetical protein